jgi:hypothetical protein
MGQGAACVGCGIYACQKVGRSERMGDITKFLLSVGESITYINRAGKMTHTRKHTHGCGREPIVRVGPHEVADRPLVGYLLEALQLLHLRASQAFSPGTAEASAWRRRGAAARTRAGCRRRTSGEPARRCRGTG